VKRILRILLRTAVVLVVLVAVVVGASYVAVSRRMATTYQVAVPHVNVPTDAASIERGRYLVTKVSVCTDCHGNNLGGKIMVDDPLMGRLAAANLTRGRGGVGSRYSDEDFVRVLTHAVRKDGHSAIYMPSWVYKLTADDMGAVIAYIRSVPPVDAEWDTVRLGPMGAVLTAVGEVRLLPAEHIDHERFALPVHHASADARNRGADIVATAGCRGCHGQNFEGGGGPPPGAANITPVGIGGWTEQDFFRAVREHRRPNGTTIAQTMPPAIGGMSDEDLRNVFSFLKTVPPTGEKSKSQLQAAQALKAL
jgi:cytochrome c553